MVAAVLGLVDVAVLPHDSLLDQLIINDFVAGFLALEILAIRGVEALTGLLALDDQLSCALHVAGHDG